MMVFMMVPTSASAATVGKKKVTHIEKGDVFYANYTLSLYKGAVGFKDDLGAGSYYTGTIKVYNGKTLKKTMNIDTRKPYDFKDNIFSIRVITGQKYKFVVTSLKKHNDINEIINVNDFDGLTAIVICGGVKFSKS